MGEGQVALVTGGAHGIGHAVAAGLESEGWRVVVADRDELSADLPVRINRSDVADEAAVMGLVAWLLGPESGFVTGAEFVTDGGMTRTMIYAE